MKANSKYLSLNSILGSRLLALILSLCTFNAVKAADETTLEFDLIEANLIGKNIFSLTLDEVTDLLGRPSVAKDPKVYQHKDGTTTKTGAVLLFHAKGLQFSFEHPEKGQKCRSVMIWLSRTWDAEQREFYLPFHGKLSKNLTGDWKVKRVMEEFSDLKPVDKSTDEHSIKVAKDVLTRAETSENDVFGLNALAKMLATVKLEELHTVEIDRPTHRLKFRYESNTRFVEKILIESNVATIK